MVKSLYSGVSGLKTHQQRMDVIGNNIANVNTTAYKTNVVTFADVYYQTKRTPSGATTNSGGINPRQVGYGVKMNTTTPNMAQSGFTYSDSSFDMAIDGEGFFQLMTADGSYVYTRAGIFNVDDEGNLINAEGLKVCGVSGDFDGQPAGSAPIKIIIPTTEDKCSSASKIVADHKVNISVSVPSDNTNMSLTFTQADYPYATYANGILNVYFDMEREFKTAEDFEEAIQNAIGAGGVQLPDDVELKFEIEDAPATDNAVTADNFAHYPYKYLVPESTDTSVNPPVTTPAHTESDEITIHVTAKEGGEFANNCKFVFAWSDKDDTTQPNNGTTAVWDENTVTITVNKNSTLGDINQALEDAANGNDKKIFYINMFADSKVLDTSDNTMKYMKDPTAKQTAAPTNATDTLASLIKDPKTFFDGNPAIAPEGGDDSLFTQIAKALTTFDLRDGRVGAEQSFKDLEDITIGTDGTIIGLHSVLGYLNLGRIDLVTFDNPNGLSAVGGTCFAETVASGTAKAYVPGTGGAGQIISGALEMSNVDLSQEFTDMITTQRGYQANSRVVTVSDTMLEELLNLKR